MTRRVLLVEIGTPAGLPVVTPPAPRPPSAWVPDPRPSPGLPPPTGLAVESVADAAVLTWTPSVAGGQTIIESAPDVAGAPGIWREVDRTGADTYTLSLPGGARWVRVRAELNGRMSVATNAVLAEPVDVSGEISEFEQELRDIADLVDTVAAQAAADAAALNARADDLRDDIDATIAEVSTLADLTEDLGTEITRVETESVARDTATVETISLLGAKNAAGTAFILDGNTLRMAPDQTLAQWRSSIQGEFASQSSRIDNEVQARQDGDQALATTLATVQATANNAATKAELTAAQNALAAADVAEANARNALAVQLRGGYTGTNPASLTQGLIYNERQARLTAEGAIASTVSAMQLDLDGKASASDLAATNLTVQQQGNTLTAHGTQLSGLSVSVGDAEASINELWEVSASSLAPSLFNPGFEDGYVGWSTSSPFSDNWNTAVAEVHANTAAAYSGERGLVIRGSGTLYNRRMNPVRQGHGLRISCRWRSGSALGTTTLLRVFVRYYDGETYLAHSGIQVTVPASPIGWQFATAMANPPPPEATHYTALIWVPSHPGVGNIVVDDVFIEDVTEAEADLLARYSLAVTAGGDVAGMQLLAGGGTSAVRFLADMFSIVSPSGDGMTLENGTQWNRRGNYSMISGPELGGDMLFYIGPTPSSPGAANKADALMFVDSAGDAYFAGRVLQGVLRWFSSTDSTASNASVSTGSNPRLGKSVSLAVRYNFGESWVYLGGTVTPGSGITRATVQIQRRYGSGAWTTLTTRDIQGVSHAYNNPGSGDPSSWNSTISGEVFASDSARTNDSEYRALISGRTVQSHSGGTSPQPVVRTQYLSIEAME